MAELELDPINLAKTYQWEIEQIDDPVDAALEANRALATLNQFTDERLQPGAHIIVRTFGAYALRQWNEERQTYVNLQYEPSTIAGESGGIGFVQNIVGNFQLKTLFIAVKNGEVLEGIAAGEDFIKRVSVEAVPRIVVPVLEIETLQQAA